MASLYFKVGADWDEVVRLRNEIAKLKQELKGMDATQSPAAFNAMNTQLSVSTKRMDELVTEAAKAGAEIEGGFKKKIYDASQVVNSFSSQIIGQKAHIKDVEFDVRRLGNAYRDALKKRLPSAEGMLDEWKAAKRALEEDKAALFGLTQQQAEARLTVKKLREEYALYKDDSKEVVDANNGIAISWKKALGVIGGIGALKALGSEIIRVRGEFQAADTAIQTLLGSKEKADALMSKVREYAKISPLEFSDVTQATQMMLGFNIEAEKVPRFLSAIGDVSMGDKQKFNSLTLAFSQMSAAGKLMGQDLNQMINAGFNPLQIMADKTGKSIATLKDEMSKGAISAEMVQQAFIDATSAGGKFYNMSENASKTINGQLSMMQDAIDVALNELGQKSEGIIMKGIQTTTSLIENYETIGKVLAGLIATYGTYRAALFTVSVIESARNKTLLSNIATTKSYIVVQKALNAVMKANPYVLLATAVVGLGTAMWALRDSSTEAEKAQKRLKERQEEAAKAASEHKQKIDGLIESLQDVSLSDMERGRSLAELRKEYPKIFSQYDIENVKLADILRIKQQINEEDSKRSKTKERNDFKALESDIRMLEASLEGRRGSKDAQTRRIKNRLKALYAERDAILSERSTGVSEQFISTFKDFDEKELDKYLSDIKMKIRGKKDSEQITMRLPIDIQGTLSEDARFTVKELRSLIDYAEKKDNGNNEGSYENDFKAAKTEWKNAKNELEKIEKDKDKFTTAQYEAAKKRKETAEKAFKNLGGDTTGKDSLQDNNKKKSQEQISNLIGQQARDNIKAEVDMANMEEQARINAMQDGFEKTMAQLKLDHKKELEELERHKQEYIRKVVDQEKAIFDAKENAKAKEDKSYKKQTFDTNAATERVKSTNPVVAKYEVIKETTIARQTDDEAKMVKKTLEEMLSEYMTYEQSRTKIAEEYKKKRNELYEKDEKGNFVTDESGNRKLRAGVVQGNIDEMDRAEKEDLAEIDEQFASRSAEFEAWMNEIGDWSLEKLKAVLAEAKAELEKLEKKNPNDPKLATARAKVNVLEKKVDKKNTETNVSPKKRSIKEWNALRDALQDCVDAFDEVGDAIGGVTGEVISTVGSVMSSTLGMINGIVQLVNMSSVSMIGTATAASKAIGMVEKASVILTIISLALQAVMAIVNLAKNISNKKHQKQIDELSDANKSLEKDLSTLGKRYETFEKQANKAYSIDASRLIEQQNTLLEQEQEMLEKKKANLNLMIAEEEAKKDSDKEQIAKYKEQIDEIDESMENNTDKIKDNKEAIIDALAGTDTKSAIEDYKGSYGDAWENGEDAAKSSMKQSRNMIRKALSEYLNTLIGPYATKYKEVLAKAMEDGIIDPYEEAQLDEILNDMDNIAENYHEKTKKYWEEKNMEDQQQTASSKGYQSLSEDTGNELVGQALAQYESNLRIEDAIGLQTGVQSGIKDIASDIRSIIADSYLELAGIRENTDLMLKPIRNLSDKIDRWDRVIMSL